MVRYGGPSGTIVATLMLASSFGVIILAGSSAVVPTLHLDGHEIIEGTNAVPEGDNDDTGLKNKWRKAKEKSRAKSAESPADEIPDEGILDLSLPNIGLKDPDEIVWPYGTEFSYEVRLTGEAYSGESFKRKFDCAFNAGTSGGMLNEKTHYMSGRNTLTSNICAEFDECRLLRRLETQSSMIRPAGVYSPATTYNAKFKLECKPGSAVGTTYPIRVSDSPGDDLPDVGTVGSPEDGFFYIGCSNAPGSLALMLNTVAWESGEPVRVWAFKTFDSFVRLEIIKLDESDQESYKWWRESRRTFNDWEPPDDVATLIINGKWLPISTNEPRERRG